MRDVPELRFDVPSAQIAARLLADPLPAGLRGAGTAHHIYRDTYFDTADGALAARGMACRIRARLDDRRFLALELPPGTPNGLPVQFEEEVEEASPAAILAGSSGPARRLRAVVDPEHLAPRLDLTIERTERTARAGILPLDRLVFCHDVVTARHGALHAEFYALAVRRIRHAGVSLRDLAQHLEDAYGVHCTMRRLRDRAEAVLEAIETQELASRLQGRREVTVIAVEQGRLALTRGPGDLRLPFAAGSGETACRDVMRGAFDSTEGQLALLGTVAATETRPVVEVWLARRLKRGIIGETGAYEWFTPADLIARAGSPVLRDPRTLAALSVAARSELLPEWTAAPSPDGAETNGSVAVAAAASRRTLAALRMPVLPRASLDSHRPVPDQFFNTELSWLEFNTRVLDLAADPSVPLLERVRFISIFSTNLDEFFSVKVAGLKLQAHRGRDEPTPDGLRPREALEAISVRLRPLIQRQYRLAAQLLEKDLPRYGVRLSRWHALSADAQATLRDAFEREIAPLLTPKAITMAPGHPFPYIEELQLSLAVITRDPRTGTTQFSHVKVPDALPRLMRTRQDALEFVPIEDVIRACAEWLYPARGIEGVHPFRLTRMGDLDLDEQAAASFAQAIEEEVQRRPRAPVVRIEVERGIPEAMRGLLLRELRFEEREHAELLADADTYAVDGMVNLGALSELADLELPDLHYPAFAPDGPFPEVGSVFDMLEERDVLVHHPYQRFDLTLQRFIEEAADDPDVAAIKLTLYRPGGPSELGNALRRAAAHGKDVSVFVELKARFDEERNLAWVKQLERAGIHVVTGLVQLKTHAKIVLIVRRAGGKARRYAHIGTGNYNPVSARVYTDLGVFTADDALTGDLAALFNDLTGSSGPPRAAFRRLLVSPTNMLERFVAMIRREIAHARDGRGGHIRAKMNALNDGEVIGTLYEASQAGVDIDLVVRGICTLRPGVPGLSERIRVVAAVGRFLEHARIYWFANGGDPEVYIGSADWRPRNLRRRVEVATPVLQPEARERLDHILQTEIDDPTAHELQSDGSYVRVTPPTGVEIQSAQEQFLGETTSS
jgi:polyphosphate kinase